MNDKYDALVIKSERLLKAAEKYKSDLRKQVKNLTTQLTNKCESMKEAKNFIEKSASEITTLKVNLQVEKDMVVALRLKYEKQQPSSKENQKENVTKSKDEDKLDEEGPLSQKDKNCGKCNYKTRNRVFMAEHKEKFHSELKCLMCSYKFKTKKNFLKHKKMHDMELNVGSTSSYPKNVYPYNCTPCEISFRSNENLMDHLFLIHLTKAQRQGNGLKKYNGGHGLKESENSSHDVSKDASKPQPCRNGESCYFHKQNRCSFFHALPPQERQNRRPRQVPTSQWQSVHNRRPQHTQGRQDHQPHGQQTQGIRPHVSPRNTSNTWCKHEDNCLQGRFCILRNKGDQGFPNLPTYRRQ